MKHCPEVCELRELMAVSWGIFWLTLKQLPQEREACLELLIKLIQDHPLDFKATFYSRQLITEVLYLLEQVPSLK